MGRRRRKKIKRVTKKFTIMTKYFVCPICGQLTLTVDFKKSNRPGYKTAIVRCGNCRLYLTMEVPEILDKIDVYNKVVDLVHEGKISEYIAQQEGSTIEGESPEVPTREEG